MSLMKCLYLATKNITKKWTQSYRNWEPILSELSIMFDGRFSSLKIKFSMLLFKRQAVIW